MQKCMAQGLQRHNQDIKIISEHIYTKMITLLCLFFHHFIKLVNYINVKSFVELL